MKISSRWLREYVHHPLSTEELSHALTMCGLEVEGEESFGFSTDGLVVGHVLEVSPHPNADRLTCCKVSLGDDSPVQIICGAPNVAAGQHVVVAPVGSVLHPAGAKKALKIRKAKIRGEVSWGMICAEDEIGLSDDHSGIMVLSDHATPGEPLSEFLSRSNIATQDTIFDIAITPNRPDAICHIGVARDISALCDVPLRRPDVIVPEVGGTAAEQVKVRIDCPSRCSRYVAMVVRGVTVKDSPRWLQQRLNSVGLRPINNIVDVTNFVMYESGQPLHAFDLRNLSEHTIIVRESSQDESITTLDGQDHALPPGTVLICDAHRPVAIGGIMGGENSEVTESTTDVLIESAYFDPSTTRRSARALGMNTDASYRFERGVDSGGQAWAAARAAALMVELGGGSIVDGRAEAEENPPVPPVITLRHQRIEHLLGTEVPGIEVERILTGLGFELTNLSENLWEVTIPSHRPDVSLEVDLIEEVVRIFGLDKIPAPKTELLPGTVPSPTPESLLQQEVYNVLQGRGYREVFTNSLLPHSEAVRFCHPVMGMHGTVVETVNAVSQTMTSLRPNLLPGILNVMRHNQHHGQEQLRFFEFGHVFHRTKSKATYIPGFSEHNAMCIVISGCTGPTEWGTKQHHADFFDLKGDVESVLHTLRLPNIRTEVFNEPTPVTSYQAVLYSSNTEICRIGCLSDSLSKDYDLKASVFFAEFHWTRLVVYARRAVNRQYTPFSRYPMVRRDISVEVSRVVPAIAMMDTIRKTNRKLLKGVTVFDVYTGKELGPSKHRIAFSLQFGANRTLKDKEVDRTVLSIINALENQHGALLCGRS